LKRWKGRCGELWGWWELVSAGLEVVGSTGRSRRAYKWMGMREKEKTTFVSRNSKSVLSGERPGPLSSLALLLSLDREHETKL
jgi:hypothetical protein